MLKREARKKEITAAEAFPFTIKTSSVSLNKIRLNILNTQTEIHRQKPSLMEWTDNEVALASKLSRNELLFLPHSYQLSLTG